MSSSHRQRFVLSSSRPAPINLGSRWNTDHKPKGAGEFRVVQTHLVRPVVTAVADTNLGIKPVAWSTVDWRAPKVWLYTSAEHYKRVQEANIPMGYGEEEEDSDDEYGLIEQYATDY